MLQRPTRLKTRVTDSQIVLPHVTSFKHTPVPLLKFGQRPQLLKGYQPFRDTSLQPRNVEQENTVIKEYLNCLRCGVVCSPVRGCNYWSLLRTISKQLPSMDSTCRVCVNVPVHNEAKVIGRFLDSYLTQELMSGSSWEVNVLLNGKKGYQQDNSNEVVDSFRKEYQTRGINLNVIELQFDAEFGYEGLARRVLNDIALLRSSMCTGRHKTLIIKYEDADNFGHHSSLLKSGIESIDSSSYLDCVVHHFEYDPFLLRAHDGILFERTLCVLTEREFFKSMSDFCSDPVACEQEMPITYRKFRPLTSGCTTFATAESLALVCGGIEGVPRLCEVSYGERISILRGRQSNSNVKLNLDTIGLLHLGSYSDARRSVRNLQVALRKGTMCFDPYADYGSDNIETHLRQQRIDRELSSEPLARLRRFDQHNYNQSLAFCQMVLDYQTYLLRNICPTVHTFYSSLSRYVDFLNTKIGFGALLFKIDLEKVKIVNHDAFFTAIHSMRRSMDEKARAMNQTWNIESI